MIKKSIYLKPETDTLGCVPDFQILQTSAPTYSDDTDSKGDPYVIEFS